MNDGGRNGVGDVIQGEEAKAALRRTRFIRCAAQEKQPRIPPTVRVPPPSSSDEEDLDGDEVLDMLKRTRQVAQGHRRASTRRAKGTPP